VPFGVNGIKKDSSGMSCSDAVISQHAHFFRMLIVLGVFSHCNSHKLQTSSAWHAG